MSDHLGDFKLATYNLRGTLNPVNDFLLAVIKQQSIFRFKEITCGVAGVDWNGSGPMHAELTFYRGDVIGNPFNQVSGVGLKVGQMPVSLGQVPPNINPFNRILHVAVGSYPISSFFQLGDPSGGTALLSPSIDIEIECDFMVLSLTTVGNQWGGGPTALLASRGFTHPINFYHQNNFEYLK